MQQMLSGRRLRPRSENEVQNEHDRVGDIPSEGAYPVLDVTAHIRSGIAATAPHGTRDVLIAHPLRRTPQQAPSPVRRFDRAFASEGATVSI